MIRAIPLRRAAVFAELVADVLDAAEEGKQFLPRSPILRAKVAGEALRVAGTPVGHEPHEAFAVDAPAPQLQ